MRVSIGVESTQDEVGLLGCGWAPPCVSVGAWRGPVTYKRTQKSGGPLEVYKLCWQHGWVVVFVLALRSLRGVS